MISDAEVCCRKTPSWPWSTPCSATHAASGAGVSRNDWAAVPVGRRGCDRLLGDPRGERGGDVAQRLAVGRDREAVLDQLHRAALPLGARPPALRRCLIM